MAVTHTEAFEALRSRLFGVAYRMLGSRAEAEDILQEAYLRWHQTDRQAIDNPEAWLVTTTSRLAIDRLRRLKTEREAYVGPWLPEPIVSRAPPPDHDVNLAEDLSIAFLTLLERLAPDERAAFLLHEAFDVGYPQIAQVLGKSDAACRQIVHRARERVRGERKRFDASDAAKRSLLRTFMTALEARDDKALLALFAPDATWTADGGGKVAASPHPISGAGQIVKLVLGLREKFWAADRIVEIATINGEPGLWIHDAGRPVAAMAIETDGQQILNVYALVNPEKLPAAVTNGARGPS
jgi:RNA polymerase sigma-70 factor (ECF subfamily)